MKNDMTKAVIYARFSSSSQNETSIEGQLLECHKYAQEHEWIVVREYIDRAQTATSDKRPQFLQMIEDSEFGDFDVILVYQLDRFARNKNDSGYYKKILEERNVKVVSAKEFISSDSSGIITEGMIEVISAWFSKQLSEKVSRGMYLNAQKCKYNGGQKTWGFLIDEDKNYVIDETVAPIIREIFERLAEGETQTAIINDLNRRMIKTSRGKKFSKNSLQAIIRNEKYKGVYSFGDVRIENGIPAIVDSGLFDSVQNELTKNQISRGHRKSTGDDYILTGKLYCGHCKSPMMGTSGRSSSNGMVYRYYMCKGKKDGCQKTNISKDLIEQHVLRQCKTQFTNELIDEIAELIVEENQKLQKSTELDRLQTALKAAENEISNLITAIEKGVAAERLSNRINEKDAEIAELKRQIEIEKAKLQTIDPDLARQYLTQLCEAELNDNRYDKVLADIFIEKIYLYDESYHLFFNVTGKNNAKADDILKLNSALEKPESVLYHGSETSQDGVPSNPRISMILGFSLFRKSSKNTDVNYLLTITLIPTYSNHDEKGCMLHKVQAAPL